MTDPARRRRSRQAAVLLLATVTTGLVAGVFGDWSHTIMPGLGATDDRTFVVAFGALNLAIYNPIFMLAFTGGLVFTGGAALLLLRAADRGPLPWVAVAFGLHLVAVVVTMVVHLPLNDALATVRDAGNESSWVAWHTVRTVATTASFGCLAWALVQHGRSSGATGVRSAPRPAPGATVL